MPLLVRNAGSSQTIFAKKNQPTVIWQPYGDPSGQDVQRVPNDWAEDIDFLNSLDAGLLEIVEDESDPEVAAKIAKQRESFRARQQALAAQVESSIDRKQDRDIIQVVCIGPHPNGRGNEECGAPVLVRRAQQGDVPPLCPRHQRLAPEFYLVQSGSKGEGEAAAEGRASEIKRVWKRTETTAPVVRSGV